ncbi:MAG: NADH-quinone oxidoreductase subunit NuoK [Pirellulales bacterium]
MNEASLLQSYLFVGAVLFALGMAGFVCRRNMIVMFLCAEMMLQGVSLSLVAWGRFYNDWGGQIMTIFILTVAACEAALALALVMMLFRSSGKLDILVWQFDREDNQAAIVDRELPEEPATDRAHWPELVPAGIEPDQTKIEARYRRRI